MGRKVSNLGRGIRWIWAKIKVLTDFACALLEMHLLKIVAFSIMALCCYSVNSLHFVVVFALLVSITFGFSSLRLAFFVIGPFLGALLLSKMLYQTRFIPDLTVSYNCSLVDKSLENAVKLTIVDPEWWGFILFKEEETIMTHYKNYLIVLFIMTLHSVIITRQRLRRLDAGKPLVIPPVMFFETTRKDADKNLRECLKYLINYCFYKFGVEITLSFCVFTVIYRQDAFALLYAIWIAILFLANRSNLSMLWPIFLGTLILSIMWQYIMAVGLSKNSCFRYPWENKDVTTWLYLPSFENPPRTIYTLIDFILLILAQRQQSVFIVESKYGERFIGGSNEDIYMHYYDNNFVNPTPDHTGNINSWLELFKFFFMRWLFRITLACEFWNGASNLSVLSLGYLVGSFVFLWIDYDICLWHIKKILKWWNFLLGYTVFVVFVRTLLEFSGRVYGDYLEGTTSWLIQLLFVECSASWSKQSEFGTTSIYWDVVCFALLIFQRRYFKSYYFLHEVDDVIGVFGIQAKGAKLMDELQENKLKKYQLRETKTLMKIKKNMNRIKAWQKKMQGLNYNEPTDHATAIYMGDYFMFEDLNDSAKLDESSSSSDEFEFDEDGEKSKVDNDVTMSKFIGTVFLKGEDAPSKVVKKPDSTISDNQDENQSSVPADESLRRRKTEKSVKLKDGKLQEEPSRLVTDILYPEAMSDKDDGRKTWRLIHSFLDSVMVSMIRFFKKYSRDYRYVQAKMKSERKIQKQQRKTEDTIESMIRNRDEGSSYDRISTVANSEDDILETSKLGSETSASEYPVKSSQALLVDLINSMCMFVMSKTELLCYVIIFFRTAFSPTLISLPLPLLVFFWGSLTTIRPTTTFWTVLIAYTEITVVIKALFRNSIFPWNDFDITKIDPDYPPLYLGIHRNNQFVITDLFLLLLLFLHRYKLKTLGLWNRTHEEATLLPQDLKVYKELLSEKDLKYIRGNRSRMQRRRRLVSEVSDPRDSIANFLQMSTWKCTSRAMGKFIYVGNKVKTKIRVKEIEGSILVTHEGRRLEPTYTYVTQVPKEDLPGCTVLRVYMHDIVPEARNLYCRLSWVQHFTSIRKFFVQILVRDWRVSTDFYTLIFIFEFLDFLIVFFGYSSFTKSSDTDSEEDFSLAENQIPILYLFTMIIHFFVIVADRILYLRKNIVGKLVLQLLLIILIHVWMFIVVPIKTDSPFDSLIIPQMYYLISCFYFLMSAYQLRVGYPLRVQGHFLCKKYGYVNYYAYKGLQLIPFFNQLRILLDFICTQSSLTMIEWMKLESIFQLVFENKCSRRADITYPVPRGQDHHRCTKLAPGIFVTLGIIIVIWLPFIVFALFNTIAQSNVPQEARLSLEIGKFEKIFATRATFSDIVPFKQADFKALQSIYKNNKKVMTFLSLFDEKDLAVLKFRFDSYRPWIITTTELSVINSTIQNLDIPITLYLQWEIRRIPRVQIMENAKGYSEIMLTKDDLARKKFAEAFITRGTKIKLNNFLPKFLHITNDGEAKPVSGFLNTESTMNPYRNVLLSIEGSEFEMWWKFAEVADDKDESTKISCIPYQTQSEITIYTFSEKNIPKLLLNISRKGILGLYLSIVFVSWAFVRRLMWKHPYIMFEDMPNPDRVLKMCHDIYLARENHEFELEEDLYAKLLFLFRSPETMIKVTQLNPTN